MKTIRSFTVLFLTSFVFGVFPGLATQKTEDPQSELKESNSIEEYAPGHSAHGEAFNEGPRQSATILGGTGAIHFEVSSPHPDVRKYVEQGIGQLHGFWYFEAERSFRQAAMLDPDCAICYWGMAMANYSNKKRAKGFLEEALERRDQASERERLYIDALDDWLNGKGKSKEKAQRQVEAFEEIVQKYPEDLEAKAWLGYTLYKQRGTLGKKHEQVDAVLREVLDVEPLHPVHHYRIHLWDHKDPKQALDSAALCGESSPSIAHMWHMPGHIYSRLKRFQDAVWQQEASARTDHANMMRDRVMPDQIHNFAHNNEWLIRNLIYIGRWRDGLDLAKNMIELPRHPTYNTLKKTRSSSYGRLRLFDLLRQYELWPELIALTDSAYLEPTDDAGEQIKRLEHRGLAFAHLRHMDQVESLLTELRKQQDIQRGKAAEANRKHREAVVKAKEEGKKAPRKPKIPAELIVKQIEKAIARVEGHRSVEYGDYPEALIHLTKAGEDPGILASVQLRSGQVSEALDSINDVVAKRENQLLPLATQIEMLWMVGETEKTKIAFEKLRSLSGSLQHGAAPFNRLERIAKELNYPSDWRVTVKHPEDFGERPELSELGPFRWSPTEAPDWKLSDHTGKEYSLDQFEGKPLIVIFYLGYGCLHCAEQLQAFAPEVEMFEKNGISLIAISTDDPKGLKISVDSYEGGMPFPLLSNDSLDVFKSYRAYDDFEDSALHGTFLIDGNGRVLWQDIGYEPFMDVDFVLKETKRLIGQEQPLPPRWEVAKLSKAVPGVKKIELADLPRIDPTGLGGSLILSGEQLPNPALETFYQLAHGESSNVVLLLLDDEERTQRITERFLSHWNSSEGAELRVVRVLEKELNDPLYWDQLLAESTGLWMTGSHDDEYWKLARTDVARIALNSFLDRGKVIGTSNKGAAIFADKAFQSRENENLIGTTLSLLPESLIDLKLYQHDSPSRLESVLQRQPHRIGFEIESNSAMVVRGRTIQKVGEGNVRIRRYAGENQPLHEILLQSDNDVADLIALRRAARDGMSGYPERTNPQPTNVNKGTLILIGGGAMPKGITKRFIKLAGGEKAKIVILPTAKSDPIPDKSGIAEEFRNLGAEKVTVLKDRTLDKVESAEFLKTLNEATGIWFGGGRQWRFVDAYLETKAHTAMKELLKRGGVIMGSSAGATIQAEFLARGNPLGNRDIMADGYQRGLGFLPGAAVDQHFSQRNRQPEMLSLVTRYPQWLGIGIDEATALIVKGHEGEVRGRGKVHFYDASQGIENDFAPMEVGDGEFYDLTRRSRMDLSASDQAENENVDE